MGTKFDMDERCRTTDHSDDIAALRAFTKNIMEQYPDIDDCPDLEQLQAVVCQAAAALLECHDATGISLDNWTGPRELVVQALWTVGRFDVFKENNV